ncbi:MAG TPA: dihydrofolate reductase family protein [Oligoflexus sp.]|uniref:dihydrofolate reductase family protein n=1 Tax=Oligoflexus sp. TaxID=1971216 RepID=UPI002D54565F|nr:dihydrofolate reductase family protein [Oligoflexus sp.]HYX37510.1 dihydrofolate reductase family protein [Oligoflexus sp.]
MRKLILEEWLSLDGFAEDQKGQLDFFPPSHENRYSDLDQLKFLDSVDTMILGRKTYELFAAFWPEATSEQEVIAEKLNSLNKIVFSTTLKQAPWGKWPAAQVMNGDLVSEIKKLKQTNGKDIVIWGSLSLAQSLMKHQLIDEYHIQLCPTMTGGGRRLFPDLSQYQKLRLVEVRPYESGALFLSYIPL